jgi:hypothetical protein
MEKMKSVRRKNMRERRKDKKMNEVSLQRAVCSGKSPFLVSKGDTERFVLASSIGQCQRSFAGWKVVESDLETLRAEMLSSAQGDYNG